jgi:DNA-binding transcriptional ArsR family regulator
MFSMAPTTNVKETAAEPVAECYEDAWQSIRATHQILSDRVGVELSEAGLPELSWHDVLSRLDESPEPLRPRDLLCRVGVTKSGLTRLLDRIEAAGLVERLSCPSDRRGTWLAMKGTVPADEIAALPADVTVFHVEPISVPRLDAERCLVWIKPKAP